MSERFDNGGGGELGTISELFLVLTILGAIAAIDISKNSRSADNVVAFGATPTPKRSTCRDNAEMIAQSVAQLEKEGYDLEPIPDGSWLTQELRRRGKPGIDPPPYVVVHCDASVQRFASYRKLPDTVFPGEWFGITKGPKEPSSFIIDPTRNRGVILQPAIRSQIRRFADRERNVRASISSRVRV